ncbi:zinc-binding dehydrogenase family superfamily [Seiridium cupressi]
MSHQDVQNHCAVLPHLKAHPMIITTSPIPVPIGSEVLIRVHAVAVNPADWAVQTLGVVIKPEAYPYVNGVDVAGEILSVGPSQKRFKPGDRVTATAMAYTKSENKYGGFQEYLISVEPLMAQIPDHVSYAEGAVLPLGLTTAAAMLYSPELMGLDVPKIGTPVNSKNKIVVVWGGSSSVGSNAIQTAKAAGYIVAATASEKQHNFMRDIGVDYVYDYTKEGVVDEIVAALEGKEEVAGVFDAIYVEPTIRSCAEIAHRLEGNKIVGTVLAPGMPVPGGLPVDVRTIVNEVVRLNQTETGKAIWVDWLGGALADGSMKCKPDPDIVGRGLKKIQDAVDAIPKGVSGRKLVVEL